jgi:IclR family transcriptional regulator, pca regulon regulatory protein
MMENNTEVADARLTERDFVGALEKGLAVIEAFNTHDVALTAAVVASKTGLTRAGARRYLLTLAKLGYAEFDGKFFRLTPRVLRLGYAYLSGAPITKVAQPILEMIGEKMNEVASLTLLDGDDVVFVGRSTATRLASVSIGIGTRLPAYCTASGRVLLMHRTDAQIRRYLETIKPVAYTEKSITDHEKLVAEFQRARRDHVSVIDEEYEIGLRSIAVPVFNGRNDLLAALTVSVHSSRMSPEQMLEHILPTLEAGARTLSSMV